MSEKSAYGYTNSRTEKRRILQKELLKLKEEGLSVFINKNEEFGPFGLITDGYDTLSVNFEGYGGIGFVTAFQWIKSKENGCGCGTNTKGCVYVSLSKEIFKEAVGIGKNKAVKYHAQTYRNFQEFWKSDPWIEETYMPL